MDMRRTGILATAILAGLSLAGALGCGGKFVDNVPSVFTFQPTQGPAGTSVVITGGGFTSVNAVAFGDGGSLSWQVNNGGVITATVPGNATTGPVVVENVAGIGSSIDNTTTPQFQTFTVTPVITGIVPDSGPAGTTVLITGSGFFGATSVTIGSETPGLPGSSSFTPHDQNEVAVVVGTAEVPQPDGSPVPVVLTASGIASAPFNFTVTP